MNVKELKESPPFQRGDLRVVGTKIRSGLKSEIIKTTSPMIIVYTKTDQRRMTILIQWTPLALP